MNSWCESCARKSCCYTMEIRPKCYLPTKNTAHNTPETYLAKSLRYSQDSHEIAKDEPQTDIVRCKECRWRNTKRCIIHFFKEDLKDDDYCSYGEREDV